MPASHSKTRNSPAKKVAPKISSNDPIAKRKEKKIFRNEDNLKVYIFRVLKEIHPEVGISKSAMTSLNSIILEVYRNLAKNARELSNHQILKPTDVQTAIKIVFPGELCKHAVTEGVRALSAYLSHK